MVLSFLLFKYNFQPDLPALLCANRGRKDNKLNPHTLAGCRRFYKPRPKY